MEIKINTESYDAMIQHAKDGLPLESCGYLAGKNGTITTFYPMTNIDKSPEHFSFDPKEQFIVVKDARAKGLDLISVYHSHPETPARLSEEDIRLLNDPGMIYIIVSFMQQTPDAKAYRLIKSDESKIEIERIEIKKI
jgi:proteasome lid subunit RPN8/RPN11